MIKSETLLVAVGGVSGVGKSTILRHLAGSASGITCRFTSHELQELSLTWTGQEFHEHNESGRDHLRQALAQLIVASLFQEKSQVLLDCHYVDINEDRNKIIQPEVLLRHLTMALFIDASTEQIMRQRRSDKNRIRSLSLKELQDERTAELTAFKQIALDYDIPCLRITITDDIVEESSRLLQTVKWLETSKGTGNKARTRLLELPERVEVLSTE